jgi:hypothetical protein
MRTSTIAAGVLSAGAILGPWTFGCSEGSEPEETTPDPSSADATDDPDAGNASDPREASDVGSCEARTEGECMSCTRASCCADLDTYLEASDVAEFDRCTEPCLDDACVDDCSAASPAAGSAYEGLVACQTESCAETCVCEAADDDSSCLACVKVSCCSTLVPFILAPDYDGFAACMEPCTDDACIKDCVASFPLAGRAYQSYSGCALAECPAECG